MRAPQPGAPPTGGREGPLVQALVWSRDRRAVDVPSRSVDRAGPRRHRRRGASNPAVASDLLASSARRRRQPLTPTAARSQSERRAGARRAQNGDQQTKSPSRSRSLWWRSNTAATRKRHGGASTRRIGRNPKLSRTRPAMTPTRRHLNAISSGQIRTRDVTFAGWSRVTARVTSGDRVLGDRL